MRYFNNFDAFMKLVLSMKDGFGNTLMIFFFTLLFSLPLGLAVALLRMSRRKIISVPTSLYILVMRGTPLMLQIFAIYFAIPTLTGVNVGQHEASQVLGMTRGQTFFHIVLPQVMKRVLLPISNEVITLVKDTSLANVIAVAELFRAAKNEASRTASVEPLFVAGLFYLLMNGVVSLVFSYLNRRMAYYKD